MPVSWGGKDNYEYSFKPENRDNGAIGDKKVYANGTNYQNNNDGELENLNLLHKKVSEHH